MPKNKKYKNMQAVMNIKLEDGTLKPLVTFSFDVTNPDELAPALVAFEADQIKEYIKFEYTEESNGESSS